MVFLHCHTPPHVLLHNGYQGIEPIRTKRLEGSEHARSKEDLGETILIFIWIIDGSLEDERTKSLQLQV
jgi:hypothetical protein